MGCSRQLCDDGYADGSASAPILSTILGMILSTILGMILSTILGMILSNA